jgi:N-acetylglucosamine kinase-like BadF-type ATPase
MTLALGIDMGGTATRWAARDRAGQIVARGAAAGASAHLFAPEARAGFIAALEEVVRASPGPVAALHAGLTGHDDAAGAESRAVMAKVFGADIPITVTDDVELAFHAVFRPGEGHLIVAGTGSVGLSIAARGAITRVGGRGILIDDAGSGGWIALRALDGLLRARDRDGDFRAAPGLCAALSGMIGGDADWPAIRAFVYGGDRGRIGTLAQAVAQAAQGGDQLAQDVLDRAARELARLAQVLIARCGPAPVAFVGGVLRLDPRIKAGLTAALPDTNLLFPTIDAAATAAALALQKATA